MNDKGSMSIADS